MQNLYEVKFNNKFIIGEENGKYVVSRTYLDNDGEPYVILFDIKNDYTRLTEDTKSRYLTHAVKRKIEDELQQNNPSLFAQIYETPVTPQFSEPIPVAVTPQNDPIPQQATMNAGQLEQGLLKMQETMMAGFNALMTKNPYEDAIVNAVIEKGKNISAQSLEEDLKSKLDEFIRNEYGALPKTIQIKDGEYVKKQVSGIFHEKYETILKVVSRNVPLMLVGPAGSGKNHTLEQVAEALDLQFFFTNAITQEYTLKGFIDANGNFHETEFYKAFTQGGLFFLDEIDASIPEALIVLNAAIANRYFDFPNGRVNAHENFRVVAAANTVGMGASNEYVGRNQLDGATLDRFAQITFDYDPQVEQQLAYDNDLYGFIVGLRQNIARNDVRYIVSMRATQNASKLVDILSVEELINTVILKGMVNEDRRLLIADLPNNKYTQALKKMVG